MSECPIQNSDYESDRGPYIPNVEIHFGLYFNKACTVKYKLNHKEIVQIDKY